MLALIRVTTSRVPHHGRVKVAYYSAFLEEFSRILVSIEIEIETMEGLSNSFEIETRKMLTLEDDRDRDEEK